MYESESAWPGELAHLSSAEITPEGDYAPAGTDAKQNLFV
jgi:hypothetical protein